MLVLRGVARETPFPVPRVLPLVAVALVLNLMIGAVLVLAERRADPDALVAEVEIVLPYADGSNGSSGEYLVRVQRLLKGDLDSELLQVRFGRNLRPEGIGLGTWERRPFRAGERLFVILERAADRGYRVRNLWLHGPGSNFSSHEWPPRATAPPPTFNGRWVSRGSTSRSESSV